VELYEHLDIPADDRYSAIPREEAEYFYRFLRGREVRRSVETGFGYGCSTAHIMAATGAPHVAIDPNERDYGDRGLKNIERLGMAENLLFLEESSQDALPRLYLKGGWFDFAFLDGAHRFDQIFTDWFYVDRMLEPGGYVFFHDTWLRSVRLTAAFIRANRKDYRPVRTPFETIAAFRKVSTDRRQPNHFREFCR
jgi:predicted O-methyltransferase YrrM